MAINETVDSRKEVELIQLVFLDQTQRFHFLVADLAVSALSCVFICITNNIQSVSVQARTRFQSFYMCKNDSCTFCNVPVKTKPFKKQHLPVPVFKGGCSCFLCFFSPLLLVYFLLIPPCCLPGRRELCSTAAGRRPHRLPTQRPRCPRARGPQHHGNHRQQAGRTHHKRDTPDL